MNRLPKLLAKVSSVGVLATVLTTSTALAGDTIRQNTFFQYASVTNQAYAIALKGGMSGTLAEIAIPVKNEDGSGGRYIVKVFDCGTIASDSLPIVGGYGECKTGGNEVAYIPNVNKSSYSPAYQSMVAGNSNTRLVKFSFQYVCKQTNGGACAYQDYMTLEASHWYYMWMAGVDTTPYPTAGRSFSVVGSRINWPIGSPYGNLTIVGRSYTSTLWPKGDTSGDVFPLYAPSLTLSGVAMTSEEQALIGFAPTGYEYTASASAGVGMFQGQIKGLADYIAARPPFSWAQEIYDAWEAGQFEPATNSMAVTVPFQYEDASASFTLFSKDTILYFFGDSWSLFVDLMKAVIWALATMYAYRRITHLF